VSYQLAAYQPTSPQWSVTNPDPAVVDLFETAFGWYHHGIPVLSDALNGWAPKPTDRIAGTTAAIVTRIWLDNPSYQQVSLIQAVDSIVADDPSFLWYRLRMVGVLGSEAIDAFINDTINYTQSPAGLIRQIALSMLPKLA
jgi:hypothetical protein